MNEQQTLSKTITPEALAMLGAPSLVYVKPVAVNGIEAFAVHAADGSPIIVVASRDAAFATALQNDMQPMSVH